MARLPVPIIYLSGNHREIGRQYGEACREQIKHSIVNAQQLISDTVLQLQLSWEGAIIQARKYLPFAEERFPKFVEELHGLAEGANISFDEIAVVNAMEAVTTDALHLTKCTSLAVSPERSQTRHVLLAHNEDWLPEDEPDLVMLHVSPVEDPPFLAMTYGALLPNIGFNADGIAQCCDSVYPSDPRIGAPRVIVSRSVLAERTPAEAIRRALSPQRAAGYNHLIAHESGELYNVEVSARKFAVLSSEDGAIAHTNHYLHPTMQAIENEPDELVATRVRYFRAQRLLRLSQLHSVESLQVIQKDHINYPDSICNHAQDDMDPLHREKTITGLIMDLTERRMFVTWGNPCQSDYFEYQL